MSARVAGGGWHAALGSGTDVYQNTSVFLPGRHWFSADVICASVACLPPTPSPAHVMPVRGSGSHSILPPRHPRCAHEWGQRKHL